MLHLLRELQHSRAEILLGGELLEIARERVVEIENVRAEEARHAFRRSFRLSSVREAHVAIMRARALVEQVLAHALERGSLGRQ